jgi:hypothetical protein
MKNKYRLKKYRYTEKNLRRLKLASLPCAEPTCEEKPKWIIVESDGLFTIIYGLCEKHKGNRLFASNEN